MAMGERAVSEFHGISTRFHDSLLGQLQLFGTMALGYYVVGLLFHILAVLLFYALLLTTMEHFVGQTHVHIAVFTTLVLSVHADAFYNVLWISNQTETLALLLCMLYLLLMLRYLASGMLVHALSGMLILFIGFFVKFSIVVLPFLFTVMAVVYWRSARQVFAGLCSCWSPSQECCCPSRSSVLVRI